MSQRICEQCSRSTAMYVCTKCGKAVCPTCFDPHAWMCQNCSQHLPAIETIDLPRNIVKGWPIGLTIFLVSFIMIVIGMLLMTFASVSSTGSSSGLVIFIGPFPIAVGAGPQSSLMIVVAFAMAIVGMFLFFLLTRRRFAVRP